MKNKFNKVNILGVVFDGLTIDKANELIIQRALSNSKPVYVVKPYVEFLAKSYSDNNLKHILNNAYLTLADGVSIQWAASYLYGKPSKSFLKLVRSLMFWIQNNNWRNQIIPEKMAGLNQTRKLLKLCEVNNLRVGIIGGELKPNIIHANILNRYKNLQQLFCWSGYFKSNQELAIVKQIKDAKLDILFVAMGFPRQEKFIVKNINKSIAKVCIGEGGSFDYDLLGGRVTRAPQKIQNAGLEWLWRLLRQPARIVRQSSILKFIFLVYKQSKSNN